MNPVLESILPVIQSSRHVRFDDEAAQRFVNHQTQHPIQAPPWEGRYHFNDTTARTVAYVLILDSLNFCFWGEPRWSSEYQGKTLNGYFALSACLKRAFERGQPLDDAEYLAQIPRQTVEELLAGTTEIPLLEARWHILKEVGQGLLDRCEGRAEKLVERAQGSALKLVELLIEIFSNFRDEANYHGHTVCFYKRAQIFCADLYGTFSGQSWGAFDDIDQLTAFADYKLPQLLRAHEIIHYEPSLAERVDAQMELPVSSEEEIEIRAYTVFAVEKLKTLFLEREVNLTSVEVDWILWNLSQGMTAKPYHRTRTTFY